MPRPARHHSPLQVGFLTATEAWGGTEVHTLGVARALASPPGNAGAHHDQHVQVDAVATLIEQVSGAVAAA